MSNPSSAEPRAPRRARRILAVGVASVWLGLLAWAGIDIENRAVSAQRQAAASLAGLARSANLLFAAEDRAIASELEALRSELRAAQTLEHPARLRSLAEQGDQGEQDEAAEARRFDGLVRRALSGSEHLGALDLVVADQVGLWVRGYVREGQAVRAREVGDDQREGLAKALWYAEEVRRAVASAGRSAERGEVSFEGEIARPWQRIAIGLHDSHSLVQGALVATADLSRISGALASLAAEGQRVTLLGVEGRPLDPSVAAGPDASRWVDLTARVLGTDAPLESFEADGQLVLGRPLADHSGQLTDLVLLVETPAPAVGRAAWLATPWPIALAGLSLASSLAIAALLRGPQAVPRVERAAAPLAEGLDGSEVPAAPEPSPQPACGSARAESPALAAGSAAPASEDVVAEVFGLREWLSDVRGCLEREAATRGLGFALRCERSLPNEVLSDSAWLGGLLVALGREALDAAVDDKVSFEVSEEAGETLRFELDAGDVGLAASGGMTAAAARLGARLESERGGRLALVVPSMLA